MNFGDTKLVWEDIIIPYQELLGPREEDRFK